MCARASPSWVLRVASVAACRAAGVEFVLMDDYARELLANRAVLPVRDQTMGEIDGRSGVVAVQAA